MTERTKDSARLLPKAQDATPVAARTLEPSLAEVGHRQRSAASGAHCDVLIVLRESHTVHQTRGAARHADAGAAAGCAHLDELGRCAQRHGAAVTAGSERYPTNIALNYPDGGHDVLLSCTLRMAFGSAVALDGFLEQMQAALSSWLSTGRRARAASIHVDGAELAIHDEHDLALLSRLCTALLASTGQLRSMDAGHRSRSQLDTSER